MSSVEVSPVELFSFAACPFAQRTRMVLIEKGIDFELTEIDVYNKPDNWSEISPYGKVPLLRHQGRVIYESAIINQYLDEAFPEPALMPADPYGRAQARIWMDYCENRYLGAAHRLMMERDDPAKRADNLAKLTEVLEFIEHEGLRKLSDGPFWLGDRPSLVDYQYMPFFERFDVYRELAGARMPDSCTRLKALIAALKERPAYQQTAQSLEYHLEQQRLLAEMRARKAS